MGMFRNFPQADGNAVHKKRDYVIAAITFLCVAISLIIDADSDLPTQNILGVIAWTALIGMLYGENREIRMQVAIAVAFATAGEYFASVYMGGYTYRLGNVPAYVPPGHGMVYLTAVALARSGLFLQHARKIAVLVVVACGLWSAWGISGIPEQGDQVGAILFVALLIYLFRGRSPMVYLAAFFITTWLELIGTALGTWHWTKLEPIFELTQGNPPSGVSAWYCLVDSVAIGSAPFFLRLLDRMRGRIKDEPSSDVNLESTGTGNKE